MPERWAIADHSISIFVPLGRALAVELLQSVAPHLHRTVPLDSRIASEVGAPSGACGAVKAAKLARQTLAGGLAETTVSLLLEKHNNVL